MREEERRRKVVQSQMALLEAATSTADAAHHVTTRLRQHLEDAIRQFESASRIMRDALLVCDADGVIQAFNPAAEMIFSMPELLHTSVRNLFVLGGNTISTTALLWESVTADIDGISPSAALRGRRGNGEIFPLETSMTRLDRSDGKIVVLILVRDLSASAETQRIAMVHEQRYHALFDLAFDAILIVQDDRVVAANKAAATLFGRRPDELLSTPLDTLVDDASVHGLEGQTGIIEIAPLRDSTRSLQLIFSGTTITWNEQPANLITVKDVSGIKGIETADWRMENNNVDMIVCFGPDYLIRYVNESFCRYYNSTRSKLIGCDIRSLLTTEECSTLMLSVHNLSPQNPTRRVQIQLADGDNTRLQDWIDHASFDEQGRPNEFQRTGRDITDVLHQLMAAQNQSR